MPGVGVARINFCGACGAWNIALGQIAKHGFTTAQIPGTFTPRRNHAQLRRQRRIDAFKSHLIIAFASATVGHGVALFFQRAHDLRLRNARTRDAGAKKVAPLIHGARHDHWKYKVRQE